MEKSQLSVITVCYNSELTICDTIESVLLQSNSNFEYIIIDGDSIDNTVGIIKSYEQSFEKKGIKFTWLSEPDNGIYDAMNKGMKLSKGKVIGYLNSDDYFYSDNVIDMLIRTFNEEDIDCCYGNILIVDNEGIIKRKWISRDFKNGLFRKSWTPAHPTFYCKRDIYSKYGGFRLDYKITSDVDLMMELLEKKNIKSKYVNKFFVIMRENGNSSVGIKSTIVITKEVLNSLKEKGLKYNLFEYLFFKFMKAIRQKCIKK